MKIFFLTPGTGSYHCGVCMRDNALARELHRQGHNAVMLPMYLPLTLDEEAAAVEEGGVEFAARGVEADGGDVRARGDPCREHGRLLGAGTEADDVGVAHRLFGGSDDLGAGGHGRHALRALR